MEQNTQTCSVTFKGNLYLTYKDHKENFSNNIKSTHKYHANV